MPKETQRKRVLVVGAGAAGMACADALSEHPDKFDVTVIEAQDYCGGQMFSIPIDEKRFGAPFLNQGVQGGSHIYHHTFHMFDKQGEHAEPVNLQVSFGKNEQFWTNVFPTQLVARHQSEIKRFNSVIKFMRWFELLFALIPIKVTLKLFLFSDEFINYMIYPSLALFLGTGNATPNLPTIMMERLYTSPTYGMWYPIDPASLSSNQPPMVVFPEASGFYNKWQASLEKRGVRIRLSTEVDEVVRRDARGVAVAVRPRRAKPDRHNPVGGDTDLPAVLEEYDEIVLCCLADTSKRLLGKTSRWIERQVLGSAKWSDDVTVTHHDADYMRKWYHPQFEPELAVSKLGERDESARIVEGKANFMPMYYIKNVPADPRKLEMSFDCTAFQAQLPKDKPFEDHVFQTIFLNKKHEETWSMHEIDPAKIIRIDWWHQLCHTYTHYLFVVPLMWLLNGRKRTTYAGAWTLVNAHELAIISGLAAAHTLGASYPKRLEKDNFALLCFRLYLLLSHGKWYSKGKN